MAIVDQIPDISNSKSVLNSMNSIWMILLLATALLGYDKKTIFEILIYKFKS